MIIKTRNTLHENAIKTFTTHPEVAGTNVLRWANPNGFSASWAIQVGEVGEEQTEVVLLGTATVAGTAGTLTANTLYEHPTQTPIYAIKYNQVVFERSTIGTAGTATPMTSGSITYQADNIFTQFDDTSGSSTYAYRTYFRNSVLNQTTTESDWITSSGFSFYSLAKIRNRIKDKLWNPSFVDDDTIDDWINEWREELINAVINVNEDYTLGTVNVGFGTDGLGTITTADFSQMRRVWITYNGVDKYQSTKMNINDFYPDKVFSSTHPYHSFQGDSIILTKPSDTAGTAELVFYRFGNPLVNDTDELPVPMRTYTRSFTDYGVAQALYKDEKDTSADRKMAVLNNQKNDFVLNLGARDKTGPTNIDLVEPISGEDALY